MSAKPKISVVMPTHNNVAKIGNAINSILKQTFKDWELIIVDDGSLDSTRQYVKRFADHRIRYFFKKHEGIVEARNYGNEMAQADWLVMQDSDDMSLPDRLEKIWHTIQLGKADVIVHGLYVNMWDEQYQCMMREYRRPGDPTKILKAQTLTGVPAFKKSVWEAKPFRFQTRYAFDWMMHLDWVLSKYRYKFIDQGLYEYIRYENSASQQFEKEGKRSQSIEKIREIVKREYGKRVGTGVLH